MGIRENLLRLEERIERAARAAGRRREDITLVAVTKTVSPERIREAYDLGIRHFGESRLQEALPKLEVLPKDIHWHFVGTLQSNKARRVAENFAVLHTLENERQLRAIAGAGTRPDALIEINIADEPQKSGLRAEDLDRFLESVLECNCVRLRGLMTVGPQVSCPEEMRPYFRKMANLLKKVPGGSWLSMGMSQDFEVAIQEGATHIRIGTALFGERDRI